MIYRCFSKKIKIKKLKKKPHKHNKINKNLLKIDMIFFQILYLLICNFFLLWLKLLFNLIVNILLLLSLKIIYKL